MRRAALLLPLLLAGCAGPASVAECGLLVHVPARAIDEGWRFDVKEVVGDPLPVHDVGYRFRNGTAEGLPVVFEGNVGELLASGGNQTLRFLDAKDDSLLAPGDAFVLRVAEQLLLQLTRGTSIVGSSTGCA